MVAVRVLKLAGMLSLLSPLAAQAQPIAPPAAVASDYRIGAGDELQVFVWKNPDLSTEVPVRPDGKITTPLVQDIQAQGKTPSELGKALEAALGNYIQSPVVTVVVKSFSSPSNAAAIRVIGSAAAPKTVPYRSGLTALDALIEVGGLATYANGNRAQLIRTVNGKYTSFPLRLADLVKSGDLRANIELMPGDIIRIPQRGF